MEEITRLGDAIKRHGRIFLERIFTPAEIAYCERHRDPVERYAGRFAAKEAATKALGTGWGQEARWRDMETPRQPGGRPTIIFHGLPPDSAQPLGWRHISL